MSSRNADTLERDTQEAVLQDLQHNEHDMAFEGLCLKPSPKPRRKPASTPSGMTASRLHDGRLGP